MNTLRRFLLTFAFVAAALCCIGYAMRTDAAETVMSGTCGAEGDNLTWTLDSAGVLTISGMGRMENFFGEMDAPWYHVSEEIKAYCYMPLRFCSYLLCSIIVTIAD